MSAWKAVEIKEMRMGFWAKNSNGRRSWEISLMLLMEVEDATAERMLVKRSVVATRGRRRVDGMRQISRSSSGPSSSSKGQVTRLTEMLLRFGSEEKILLSISTSQDVGMCCSLRDFSHA